MTIMVFDEVRDLIQNLPSPSTSLPIIIGDLNCLFKSLIHPDFDFKISTQSVSLCQYTYLTSCSSANKLDIIITSLSNHVIECINPA